MAPLRPRLSPVALVIAAACTHPFEPRERTPEPAMLNLTVLFADTASAAGWTAYGRTLTPRVPGATVTGEFQSGTDTRGRRRAVVNDTLRVLGLALTRNGTTTTGGGGIDSPPALPPYVGFAPVPEAEFTTRAVVVEKAPTVAGVSAPQSPTVYAVGRAGSDTLTITRGSDLRLALAVPAPLAPGEYAYWSVTVIGDAGAAVTLNGPGLPPASIRLAAEVLPATASGILRPQLYTGRTLVPAWPAGATGAADYGLLLNVATRLAWRVRVVAP